MFASRTQHIKEVIEPGFGEGKIVLCDRFTDSTEAYQGGGRKLGSEPVSEYARILCGGLQPDLTILMDSDVAHSVERARRRNRSRSGSAWTAGTKTGLSRRVAAFFGRVREAYHAIARREHKRVVTIDARGTIESNA